MPKNKDPYHCPRCGSRLLMKKSDIAPIFHTKCPKALCVYSGRVTKYQLIDYEAAERAKSEKSGLAK